MAMMKGGETVCEYIEAKAEEHLIRLTLRMEWFTPIGPSAFKFSVKKRGAKPAPRFFLYSRPINMSCFCSIPVYFCLVQ